MNLTPYNQWCIYRFFKHWSDLDIIIWISKKLQHVCHIVIKLKHPIFSLERTDIRHQTLYDLSRVQDIFSSVQQYFFQEYLPPFERPLFSFQVYRVTKTIFMRKKVLYLFQFWSYTKILEYGKVWELYISLKLIKIFWKFLKISHGFEK